MTRNQVFAMHSTAPELPPPVGEFPLNSTSLVATPPSAVEGKVKKSNGKKKKLSVREMVSSKILQSTVIGVCPAFSKWWLFQSSISQIFLFYIIIMQ